MADRAINKTIYNLYVRGRYKDCLREIESTEKAGNMTEYSLFIKGMICRQEGRVQDSYTIFEQVTELNPSNQASLKQLARSATLLGMHRRAIQIYTSMEERRLEDWETWYHKGVCLMFVQDYEASREAFLRSNDIERHLSTYLKLGKLCVLMDDYDFALRVYTEALGFAPIDPGLLRTVGLLKLRLGDATDAFQLLGKSLVYQRSDPQTLLAVASVIQDSGDIDAALAKYRAVAAQRDQAAQLWSNIGMCFFNQGQPLIGIQCLRRARYLCQFEWIISYNLGLVHYSMGHLLSAFFHLRAAAAIKPDYPQLLALLGMVLCDLGDSANCITAFTRALTMDDTNSQIKINFITALFKLGERQRAMSMWAGLQKEWGGRVSGELRTTDPEAARAAKKLARFVSITS